MSLKQEYKITDTWYEIISKNKENILGIIESSQTPDQAITEIKALMGSYATDDPNNYLNHTYSIVKNLSELKDQFNDLFHAVENSENLYDNELDANDYPLIDVSSGNEDLSGVNGSKGIFAFNDVLITIGFKDTTTNTLSSVETIRTDGNKNGFTLGANLTFNVAIASDGQMTISDLGIANNLSIVFISQIRNVVIDISSKANKDFGNVNVGRGHADKIIKINANGGIDFVALASENVIYLEPNGNSISINDFPNGSKIFAIYSNLESSHTYRITTTGDGEGSFEIRSDFFTRFSVGNNQIINGRIQSTSTKSNIWKNENNSMYISITANNKAQLVFNSFLDFDSITIDDLGDSVDTSTYNNIVKGW